ARSRAADPARGRAARTRRPGSRLLPGRSAGAGPAWPPLSTLAYPLHYSDSIGQIEEPYREQEPALPPTVATPPRRLSRVEEDLWCMRRHAVNWRSISARVAQHPRPRPAYAGVRSSAFRRTRRGTAGRGDAHGRAAPRDYDARYRPHRNRPANPGH